MGTIGIGGVLCSRDFDMDEYHGTHRDRVFCLGAYSMCVDRDIQNTSI